MALDFPATPSNGQQFTSGGTVWTWDGAKWVAGATTSAFAPVNSPVFTGDPQAPQPAAGDADASIATTAFVTNAVATSLHDVGRNYLHNSMFNIAQRSGSPWVGSGYTLDRWSVFVSAPDTVSYSQVTLGDAARTGIGDEEANFALQNVFVGNSAAGALNNMSQRIENVRRLAGKTITVSFTAACFAGTLKIGINATQSFGTGGAPSANVTALATGMSVTISPTWGRYSVTFAIPSAVGKTFGTTASTDWTAIQFYFSSGATSAAVSGNIGVQSGTIQLWGVQLEVGPTATPLEKLDPVTQLQQCMRFFQTGQLQGNCNHTAGNTFTVSSLCPVPLRSTTVTFAITGGGNLNCGTTALAYNGLSLSGSATVTATAVTGINTVYTVSADL